MAEDSDKSLLTHLEELRAVLIRCFVSVGVMLPIMFWLSPKVMRVLIRILISDNKLTLNYFSPMEVFVLEIKLGFLMAFIAAFPYIVKQLWGFILPALYEHERKFISVSVFLSGTLFVLGVIFCIFLILPIIINFGISFAGNEINAMFGITNVINLCLWLSLTFGLMFQIPLITHMLIKYDIVSYSAISSKRPYVVVILLVCAALMTPPDIVSQVLLFAPTYLLFEVGLLFSKEKKDV